jgi:hypothetical protein
MKFVIAYTPRSGGTAAENVADGESAQKLLSSWAPSGTIREWVQRCDGDGGFAVVENDNATDLFRDLGTWTPWLEFQVFPVVDLNEGTNSVVQETLATARSVL